MTHKITILIMIAAALSGCDSPALVGYGCEGTSGPIYAEYEDQFPPCEHIERNGNALLEAIDKGEV